MEEGRRGLAGVRSINHDPCYHELYCLSSINIVLVFRKWHICSNDFTSGRKQRGRAHCEGVRERTENQRQNPHPCTTQPARMGHPRRKLIHRESFRASVLKPLWQPNGAAKHGGGKVSLDNAFALIEGHPGKTQSQNQNRLVTLRMPHPPLDTFPGSTAVIFSPRSPCPQIQTFQARATRPGRTKES